MWRAVLDPLLLFASPFAAYAAYLVLRRIYPFTIEHWTEGAVSTLALAGLAIAAAACLPSAFSRRATRAPIYRLISRMAGFAGRLP